MIKIRKIKKLIIFVGVSLLLFSLILLLPKKENLKVMNYYLPEDFQGCAYVFYNVESEPPLTLKDGVIDYHFNEDGILLTSSPPDFGWEGKNSSGFYKVNYYFGDRLMDIEEITFSSLGEGYVDYVGKYYYERIGVKEEYCTDISGVARRIFQNQ